MLQTSLLVEESFILFLKTLIVEPFVDLSLRTRIQFYLLKFMQVDLLVLWMLLPVDLKFLLSDKSSVELWRLTVVKEFKSVKPILMDFNVNFLYRHVFCEIDAKVF